MLNILTERKAAWSQVQSGDSNLRTVVSGQFSQPTPVTDCLYLIQTCMLAIRARWCSWVRAHLILAWEQVQLSVLSLIERGGQLFNLHITTLHYIPLGCALNQPADVNANTESYQNYRVWGVLSWAHGSAFMRFIRLGRASQWTCRNILSSLYQVILVTVLFLCLQNRRFANSLVSRRALRTLYRVILQWNLQSNARAHL